MENVCVICEGEFHSGALDENSKCAVCRKEYPNAKDRAEALRSTMPEKEQMSTLTEGRVREVVKEEILKCLAKCKNEKEKEAIRVIEEVEEITKEVTKERTEEEQKKIDDKMAKARAARAKNTSSLTEKTDKETD